ncbi:hypothetical protein ACX7S9_003384 [Morganella morganii]|uniref:hypothetical protein n=2 Tax=Enterobacterales TaxID=91347 RepID=UPI000667D271|nr:hypothetical protein [Morganella morganii]SSN08918.1 Uncharacterised protein [Klebsiella pneumoniae]EJD6112920.1 hypothetical protein [Morganella morganii]EJG2208008.1 hypothetical protein [Morganella morganii]EKU4017392.1 hypothetical protein [Morganella morganii]ELA7703267.1 hypothetical protein [Morganella morganii]
MNNTEINHLVDFIYQDDRITNAEFQMIRDEADKRFDAILEYYGKNNSLSAFQKSADVTVQLMQESFFILKKKAETPEQKDEIKDAFNAQISYIIACYNRFFDSL